LAVPIGIGAWFDENFKQKPYISKGFKQKSQCK